MVYVEHGALGSFGQHVLAFGQQTVNLYLRISELELAHIFYAFEPEAFLIGDIIVCIMEVAQDLFVPGFQRGVFLGEVVADITYAQACTAGLLAVSGAYALACSTDLVLAFSRFVGSVEHAVGG